MADVKGLVTKKIGPLPVWAYVVGGAAAVFLLGKFRGGSSSAGGGAADVIRIPTLGPGTPSDPGFGSPVQPGGPGGTAPSTIAATPVAEPISSTAPTQGSGNTGLQSSASSGRRPADDVFNFIGKTAAQIAEAGKLGFIRTGPSSVSTGGSGVVAPTNVLVGFADPATGNLEPNPGPGRVPVYR